MSRRKLRPIRRRAYTIERGVEVFVTFSDLFVLQVQHPNLKVGGFGTEVKFSNISLICSCSEKSIRAKEVSVVSLKLSSPCLPSGIFAKCLNNCCSKLTIFIRKERCWTILLKKPFVNVFNLVWDERMVANENPLLLMWNPGRIVLLTA